MFTTILTPDVAKQARAAVGLSQSKVAQATGISRTSLALFEVKKYLLDDDTLTTLKQFYQDAHPFRPYQSFIAIRKCLGFRFQDKKTYDKMYGDWQDLINRKDYGDHFHTDDQENLYHC